MSRLDLASTAERMVETRGPKFGPSTYPNLLLTLNPWLYWQLAQGPPTATDSAQPDRIGCGGGSWNLHSADHPPHDGAWGTSPVSVAGVLNDTRTALATAVGTVPSETGFSYAAGADPPIWPPGNIGTWFHYAFKRNATPTKSNVLWDIPTELGLHVNIGVDEDAFFDTFINIGETAGGNQHVSWAGTSGPVGGKHHHVMLLQNQSPCSITLWADGVNQGTKSITVEAGHTMATQLLSEGIFVGAADGVTMQDCAIGGTNISPGCAVSDAVALMLYTQWAKEL